MIAIVGGGIAGLATAYQLAYDGVEFTLFEASERLGGIVETVHRRGFRYRVRSRFLGHGKAMGARAGSGARPRRSNHPLERSMAAHVCAAGQPCAKRNWSPFPDGMRMMVPTKWGPLLESPLFSWQARLAYLREPKRAEELKQSAPAHDESVADFVRRHFGAEVANTIAGPLLAAVFGGDIAQLSVRAVMPAFVRMEAEEGSLIQAVQRLRTAIDSSPSSPPSPVVSRRSSTAWLSGCRQHPYA